MRAALATALLLAALALTAAGPAAAGGGRGAAALVPSRLLEAAHANPDQVFEVIVQGRGKGNGAAAGAVGQAIAHVHGNAFGLKRTFATIDGVSAELTGAQLVDLAGRDDVLAITADDPLVAAGDSVSTCTNCPFEGIYWPFVAGVTPFWQGNGKKAPAPPQAPAIAVVDSGIDAPNTFFGSRVVKQLSLASLGTNSPGDGYGHGTFVAGLAAGTISGWGGASPTSKVVSLDVVNDEGEASTSDVLAAADWIYQNKDAYGIRVATFALTGTEPTTFMYDPLDKAVEKLWLSGVVVVAAAGNYGKADSSSGVLYAPANDPFVVTVGATDMHDTLDAADDFVAPWSAYGYTPDGFAKPELSAPGRYMIGTVPTAAVMPTLRPDRLVATGWMWMSGTSFAVPVVAGSAADLLAVHPGWTAGSGEGRPDADREAGPGWAGLERWRRAGAGRSGGGGRRSPEPEPRPASVPRARPERRSHSRLRRRRLVVDGRGESRLGRRELDDRLVDDRVLDDGKLDDRLVDDRELDDCLLDDGGPACRRSAQPDVAAVTRSAAVAPRADGADERGPRAAGLPAAAWAYLATVVAAAAATLVPLLPRLSLDPHDLLVFGFLAAGAALGSFLIVSTEPNHGFNTALLFITAAALLLPPELVALIAIVHVCPEIVRRGFPWYSQVFNAANYTLNALAAWAVFHLLAAPGPTWADDGRTALATGAACLVLVGSNHALLAVVLRLARARSFRESGLFSWKSLSTELLLASLGATLAVVWRENIYLAPFVLAPFVLINRSFSLLDLLRRSEGRFRAIFESTAMGIRLTDTDGRIVDANNAFAQMIGVEPQDLLGTTIDEVVHGDDLEAHADLVGELVEGRQERLALEQRYVRADGNVGWAHLTESLVRDADGTPSFTIGMVHDVTDRKLLEERLNQTQKMEAVGRLAGGVAHDFNNLLTVIAAHSQFLLGSLEAGEPIGRDDVEAIAKAAEKAGALTDQLLAFGRRQLRQPRVLDLNAIVLEMYTLLDRTIGAGIRIGLELEASLAHVQADAAQIEQVLVNLALNAGDAMPGGGELTIRTATVPPPAVLDVPRASQYVLLSVGDTGCGMDAETKARMFEPFFTTKQAKGTGLGLASVYGIVAQSGGLVDVDSKPGGGTTIRVYLPAAAEGATTNDGVVSLPARTGGGRRILLVDDEDLVRTAARRILAARGYTVLEAFDALEALEIARGQEIDLLVTDLVMPRMNGRRLHLRLHGRHGGVAAEGRR